MILSGCSVERNTGTTRFYHSLTARFNIYFNGYESFKAGVNRINSSYRDDYAEVLNVFEYSDPSTARVAVSEMDRAIQKASKLISQKSITAKPEIRNKRDISEKEKTLLNQKEYNEWVDDSYLLIGKARFYKHEFTDANSVFNYCITEANDPLIRTEASIWLARVHNETGNFSESFRILNDMNVNELHDDLRSMYYTTLADLFARQKRYNEAIDPLSKAVELVSGKRNRYRLTYLLAQLCEATGNGARATALYRDVVKMNPPYEVEFNARINMAGSFDISTGNPAEIRKELERMLKDSKNKEFHDQIYFALGSLSMKEGNDAEALGFFRKSASSSTQNQNQKGRSYLSLADYFYSKADYMNAGMYYDSAVYFMDQAHPQYTELKTKSQKLGELVSQLKIIEREDSLQRVAMMPTVERNQLISTIIANASKAQSEGKNSEYADRYNIGQYYENERRFAGNIEQEGKWYFYNQAALTFGRTEFRRRWGDRKLEDNWRRSNRTRTNSVQPGQNPEEAVAAGSDSAKKVIDNKSPEFYLRDLPMTDSLLNISNEKLSNAMLDAGKAYSEIIADPAKATETFESLVTRFPSSPLIPETLFNLYRVNKDINSTKSEGYKQQLIARYPESEFAHILSDPAYYEKKMENMKAAEELYRQAYELYEGEKFEEAIALANTGVTKYPDNLLAPKFMLLHAYSVARMTDERTFKEDLTILTETYPGTAESDKAKELIAYLNKKVPELKVEEDKVIAKELFVADTTSARIFAIVIPDPSFNINQATFDVISYNIDNYTNKNYRTEGTLIDNKFILITISGFKNFEQSLSYYKNFLPSKQIRNAAGKNILTFVISNENLNKLLEDKSPERYDLFFRENFLK